MKKIKLTRGKYALVDDEMFDELNKFNWNCRGDGYAARFALVSEDTKRTLIMMHSYIMKTPEGFHTDHINNNKLDNRRENLRIVTPAQNQVRSFKCTNTSGFKGVSFNKRIRKWDVRTSYKDKQIFIGNYKSKEEAALAYNERVKMLYGDFAYLNKI